MRLVDLCILKRTWRPLGPRGILRRHFGSIQYSCPTRTSMADNRQRERSVKGLGSKADAEHDDRPIGVCRLADQHAP
jgi:hypothetical protein